MLQYKDLRPLAEKYESDPLSHVSEIDAAYARGKAKEKNRYLFKKARIALKRVLF